MIKETLQECAKLAHGFKSLRKKREQLPTFENTIEMREKIKNLEEEILHAEKAHKQMILILAQKEQILEDVLNYMSNKNKVLVGQAFLIILESKNTKYIQQLIEKYLFNFNKRYEYFKTFVYISEEAFDTLFHIMKNIGFDKNEFHIYVTMFLLKYISVNYLTNYLEYFYKLDNFSMELQKKILDKLVYFEEFNEVILKAYYNKHPYFFEDYEYNAGNRALVLLLQKKDAMALEILRKQENINQEDVILHLILHGDKEDGKVIANSLMSFIKNKQYEPNYSSPSAWLYQKLDFTLDTSSPLLYANILEAFLIKESDNFSFDELIGLLDYKLTKQFGAIDKQECNKILQRLKKEYKKQNIEYECWKEHSKKDTRRKYLSINLPTNQEYSILDILLSDSDYPLSRTLAYDELVISTGKYFPLNSSGYYTTLKKHAEVWLEYLERNREKYEPGRWIRYGKYVD